MDDYEMIYKVAKQVYEETVQGGGVIIRKKEPVIPDPVQIITEKQKEPQIKITQRASTRKSDVLLGNIEQSP